MADQEFITLEDELELEALMLQKKVLSKEETKQLYDSSEFYCNVIEE